MVLQGPWARSAARAAPEALPQEDGCSSAAAVRPGGSGDTGNANWAISGSTDRARSARGSWVAKTLNRAKQHVASVRAAKKGLRNDALGFGSGDLGHRDSESRARKVSTKKPQRKDK